MKGQRNRPLSLRLIEIESQNPDAPNVFLLPHLFAEELPDEKASVIDKMRWGVEVLFRTAKQTLESVKLRSWTPKLALLEAAMLFVSLSVFGGGGSNDCKSTSGLVGKKRHVINQRVRHSRRSGGHWNRKLTNDLRESVTDESERKGSKSTRQHPQIKKEKPPSLPKTSERQRVLKLIS